MTTLTRKQAKKFLINLPDKIFGVTFDKKSGEERTMSARLNVEKHLEGGEIPYDPDEYDLIPVYDMNNGYRMINVDGLKEIRVDGEVIDVE